MEDLNTQDTAQADQNQVAVIEKTTDDITTQAKLAITSPEAAAKGWEILKAIKGLKDQVIETFAKPKDLAHKAHKAITEAEKKHLAPLDAADSDLRKRLSAYQAEQDRIRYEAEAKARKEREETERQEREAAAARAAIAREMGDEQAAEEILTAPVVSVADAPMPSPKVGSYREDWKAEVIDLSALVAAVAAGKAPLALLLANTTAINQQAKSLKAECKIPGVKVWADKTAVVR